MVVKQRAHFIWIGILESKRKSWKYCSQNEDNFCLCKLPNSIKQNHVAAFPLIKPWEIFNIFKTSGQKRVCVSVARYHSQLPSTAPCPPPGPALGTPQRGPGDLSGSCSMDHFNLDTLTQVTESTNLLIPKQIVTLRNSDPKSIRFCPWQMTNF